MDKPPKMTVTGDELGEIAAKLDELRADAQCIKLNPEVVRRLVKDHHALLTYHRAYQGM